MYFPPPVTDVASLVLSSNVWCCCQWNQALHEFKLIIHIRHGITTTDHRSGSVLCSVLTAESQIIELCPLPFAQRPWIFFHLFIYQLFKCIAADLRVGFWETQLLKHFLAECDKATSTTQKSLINWNGLECLQLYTLFFQSLTLVRQ